MEDTFDIKKIEAAIRKANESVIDYEKLTEEKIQEILANVEKACENMKRSPSVEEIQDMVENQIMSSEPYAKRSTHGTMIMFARIGGTDTR